MLQVSSGIRKEQMFLPRHTAQSSFRACSWFHPPKYGVYKYQRICYKKTITILYQFLFSLSLYFDIVLFGYHYILTSFIPIFCFQYFLISSYFYFKAIFVLKLPSYSSFCYIQAFLIFKLFLLKYFILETNCYKFITPHENKVTYLV